MTTGKPHNRPSSGSVPSSGPSAPSPSLAISARGVTKAHVSKQKERLVAVDNVSLDVRSQEFVTIVGPSGCGKSTLLNLMAGLLAPDSGDIRLLDEGHPLGRHGLGFISQANTLMPWRTVLANVEIGLEISGMNRKQRRERARHLMHRVGLDGFEKSYPFELSGGMQKRLAVIRTLAYDPKIIFMDEPFVGLDVQTRDALEEDILKLWLEQRKTIVMVTHDLTEAITLSDRVVLMTARPGTIRAEYDIPLPRPRSVSETRFLDDFVSIHRQIWQDLSTEVLRAAGEEHHA